MRKRRFGPTGSDVPVIGIGTWNMERDDKPSAIAAIRRALELGLTHVDTAEMYGNGQVESLVGEAIAGLRDSVYLVSKVLPNHASYAGTLKACEASLKRLGTDHLDCFLLHWAGNHPLADTIRAFEELKAAGKIRAWGVSNFDDAELDAALAIAGPGKIACNQVLYHLHARTIEHRVVPWCKKHDVAVVAYSPFGSRNGFPRNAAFDKLCAEHGVTPHQAALAFLTRADLQACVFAIPKSSRVAHVEDFAPDVQLPADALAAIDRMFPLAPWRGLESI